jgi:hypothetical protein
MLELTLQQRVDAVLNYQRIARSRAASGHASRDASRRHRELAGAIGNAVEGCLAARLQRIVGIDPHAPAAARVAWTVYDYSIRAGWEHTLGSALFSEVYDLAKACEAETPQVVQHDALREGSKD